MSATAVLRGAAPHGTNVATLAAVFAAASMASRAADLLPLSVDGRWGILLSATAFLGMSAWLLLFLPRETLASLLHVPMTTVAAFALFVSCATLVRPGDEQWSMGALATLFACATAEETVFRRWLPGALASQARWMSWRSATPALLASQLLFALCHVVPLSPGAVTHPWSDFARLFVLGCLYALLVRECGVLLTAAIHAAMNAALTQVTISRTLLGNQPAIPVVLAALAITVVLFSRTRRSERTPATLTGGRRV